MVPKASSARAARSAGTCRAALTCSKLVGSYGCPVRSAIDTCNARASASWVLRLSSGATPVSIWGDVALGQTREPGQHPLAQVALQPPAADPDSDMVQAGVWSGRHHASDDTPDRHAHAQLEIRLTR